MRKPSGCATGCGVLVVALVALLAFGYIWGQNADTVRVTGTVHVSISSACESPKLQIRPEGKAWQTVRFESASWRIGQPCTLPVDIDLPPADRYTVRMDGVGTETIPRDDGATTVRFALSW